MHLTYVSTEISNCLLNPQFQSKEKKKKFNYVTLITDSLSTAVAAETWPNFNLNFKQVIFQF